MWIASGGIGYTFMFDKVIGLIDSKTLRSVG